MHDPSTAYLTHIDSKSNFITLPNAKIAHAGILDRIEFDQWHIYRSMRSKTSNINVINLASLIAVFARMGIPCYEISQNDLAEKMYTLFEMPKCPTRSAVSRWELELQKIGCISIPRHVDWGARKTKIRSITPEFWHDARAGMQKISYTLPHVTTLRSNPERVKPVNTTPNDPVNSVIPIRARSRANHNSKTKQIIKFIRPPANKLRAPKKMARFENSVAHWLFQNHNIESYREAVILMAQFLTIQQGDDYCAQLRRRWSDCTDASRPGMVSALIAYLRDYMRPSPLPSPPQDLERKPANAELAIDIDKNALRQSLIFGAPPPLKYQKLVGTFRKSDPDNQDRIISELQRRGLI